MSKISFKRLDEKGWAITPRGKRRWFSTYEAVLDGKRLATIEGFMSGWSIWHLPGTGSRTFCTLADAKRFLVRHVESNRQQ